MLADMRAVMYKEWRELLAQRGNPLEGGGLLFLLVVAIFVIGCPLVYGPGWEESPMALLMSAWLPFMLAATSAADSFAGERERRTLETLLATRLPDRAILLGKILAAVCYGSGVTLVTLALQLVVVNVAYGGDNPILYQGIFLWGSVLLSLLAAGLAASAGALISLRAPTAQQAYQTLSLGAVVLPFALALGGQVLPLEWKAWLAQILSTDGTTTFVLAIAAILAVLDAALFIIATVRFRRARLILD